jgi:hypothetical protein
MDALACPAPPPHRFPRVLVALPFGPEALATAWAWRRRRVKYGGGEAHKPHRWEHLPDQGRCTDLFENEADDADDGGPSQRHQVIPTGAPLVVAPDCLPIAPALHKPRG